MVWLILLLVIITLLMLGEDNIILILGSLWTLACLLVCGGVFLAAFLLIFNS